MQSEIPRYQCSSFSSNFGRKSWYSNLHLNSCLAETATSVVKPEGEVGLTEKFNPMLELTFHIYKHQNQPFTQKCTQNLLFVIIFIFDPGQNPNIPKASVMCHLKVNTILGV